VIVLATFYSFTNLIPPHIPSAEDPYSTAVAAFTGCSLPPWESPLAGTPGAWLFLVSDN